MLGSRNVTNTIRILYLSRYSRLRRKIIYSVSAIFKLAISSVCFGGRNVSELQVLLKGKTSDLTFDRREEIFGVTNVSRGWGDGKNRKKPSCNGDKKEGVVIVCCRLILILYVLNVFRLPSLTLGERCLQACEWLVTSRDLISHHVTPWRYLTRAVQSSFGVRERRVQFLYITD